MARNKKNLLHEKIREYYRSDHYSADVPSTLATGTPVEILTRARNFFKQHPWFKYAYWGRPKNSKNIGYCALGAFNMVTRGEPNAPTILRRPFSLSINRSLEYLDKVAFPHTSISGLNDYPTTRKKDVIAAYDKAIELARSEEGKGRAE